MQVRVLYFGVLKDTFAMEQEQVDLPVASTVSALLDVYCKRAPELGTLWRALAVAVNREYAGAECVLHEGDEVALLPPVSGGCCSGSKDLFAESSTH